MKLENNAWIESNDIVNESENFKNQKNLLQTWKQQISPSKVEAKVGNSDDIMTIAVQQSEFVLERERQCDIVLDLISAPQANSSHSEVDLAIVLDVSGSMSGTPLQYSKQAIVRTIDTLHESDYLHYVTYSTRSSVEFHGKMTEDNKIKAKEAVLGTRTRGCTNLVSGVISGVESMLFHSTCHSNKRMFLFSDGMVNEGVTRSEEISALVQAIHENFNINISTFGFGNQFDEALMKSVSRMSHGNYAFIDGIKCIAKKMDKAIELLQSLYAIDSNLTLLTTPCKYINPHIEYVHGYEVLSDSATTCELRDLFYKDFRKVLFSLSLEQRAESIPLNEPIRVMKYTLNYSALEDCERVARKKTGEIYIQFTDDAAKVQQPESLIVTKAINHIYTIGKKATEHVTNEKYDEALEIKKESLRALQAVKHLDDSGMIGKLIKRTKRTIEKFGNEQERISLEKDLGEEECQDEDMGFGLFD